MATNKDAEAKKDVEPKKDAGTGEKSIEYIVDGLTEEQLKGVSGGLATGDATKQPRRCVGVSCQGLTSSCYAFCRTMLCPSVRCESLECSSFDM